MLTPIQILIIILTSTVIIFILAFLRGKDRAKKDITDKDKQ